MDRRKRLNLAALVMAGVLGVCSLALGQANYPTNPIKVIIPLAPGGAIDVMVRALGKGFEQRNPYGFVVESRAGANTIIAANACKAAAPDGYTLCLLSRSTVSINPWVYKNLSYDPVKDFEPITNLAFANQVLIMNRKVPVNNWQELVAYSKEHPDKLNFGSFGLGGDSHLIVEWMKHVTGANITHIPYKGASDALLAFTAGDIQLLYLIVGNLDLPRQINDGEIKGLLVPGKTRNPIIPNVPTFAESGLPSDQIGYETWFGMFAPKGTPQPIIKKLNADFTAIVKTPEFAQQYLTTKGFEPEGDSADHFAQFIQDDLRKAKTFVGITGVALEQ